MFLATVSLGFALPFGALVLLAAGFVWYSLHKQKMYRIAAAIRSLNMWHADAATFTSDYSPRDLEVIRELYDTCSASSYGLPQLDKSVQQWAERVLGLFSPGDACA